ncbi:hypothetical protein Angca_000839, partial [Angiostrongylus cantonensis]
RYGGSDELYLFQTNIHPYLISLDIEMCSAEAVLRFNIDRSKIHESRIDWLLTYTKYQVRVDR